MPPATPTVVALAGSETVVPSIHTLFVSLATMASYLFWALRYAAPATHVPTPGQLTLTTPPLGPACTAPAGRRSTWARCTLPFTTLSRKPWWRPVLSTYCPTSAQLPGVEHDAPLNPNSCASGLGAPRGRLTSSARFHEPALPSATSGWTAPVM